MKLNVKQPKPESPWLIMIDLFLLSALLYLMIIIGISIANIETTYYNDNPFNCESNNWENSE